MKGPVRTADITMFKEVSNQIDFPKVEKEILAFWDREKIYEKSLEQRKSGKPFVFFEGPPTANGLPHPGHCLTRAIKDLFPRFKTMTGHYVLRKGGWDTHGLPVEVEVCKELGIHTKEEIEKYGVEAFNRKCLESVFRYTKEWEELTRRLGFWVNLEEAYVTYHQSYIESVWWSLKQLFDAGLLYQGHKIVWWWAQGGTALSSGEVGQGYREVDDPSVYVRFPIVMDDRAKKFFADCGLPIADLGSTGVPPAARVVAPGGPGADTPHVSLLVWTTTPWTLPSNMYAAVHKDFDYAIVLDEETGERLVFAEALVDQIAKKAKKKSWKVERTVKGSVMLGLSYRPPFDFFRKSPAKNVVPHADATTILGDYKPELAAGGSEYACWRVLHADFVTLESGTGLVHEAPAFGEVDFDLLQEERKRFKNPDSIPLLCAVAPNGAFTDDAPPYKGRWVKDCDKDIIRDLKERGLLLHQEQYRHDYPFCWRADEDPLIQYPRRSWFIRTTQFKDAMLANNERINWLPEHIKAGRFGKFLESNVDWSLSRERYWGTPLPIWVCESCGHMEANDSYESLSAKPGIAGLEVWENAKKKEPALSDHLKIHKPYIDALTYDCPKCAAGTTVQSRDRKGAPSGVPIGAGAHSQDRTPSTSDRNAALCDGRGSVGARMRRVPEVIDCWYDSGAMPFAQWGFPHQNREMFASQYPADFISEALDQTRGWFYSLVAIATLLFGERGVARPGSAGVSPAGNLGVSPATNSHPGVLPSPITGELSKRRRWKLPHSEAGGCTYFLTFRVRHGELNDDERTIVLNACRYWDQSRICLHAAVVMPDHVHLLCTPQERQAGVWWSVADLLHSIKSFTSHEIGGLRKSAGSIWQQEYYDRIIRSGPDFEEKWNYIIENPMRRGLGDDYQWIWVENPDAIDKQFGGRDARTTQSGRDARNSGAGETPALPYPLPFRNCIVLGLLMGEDGLKMSKSKKNYKEPTYIFEHEGADAMRWLFFSGQTPWTSIRFQESAIAEGQREFLIRLYNCYSFFVIYANIDKWSPATSPARQQGAASELDRWILSELAHCSVTVFDRLNEYDNYNAAKALISFVDALSNWYVRRSRDRFWKSEMDAEKNSAYATLYECLVTTSKLIAPFTPFIAESMYQNLALEGSAGVSPAGNTGVSPTGNTGVSPAVSPIPLSVHLCDYPVTEKTRSDIERRIDKSLNEEIEIIRQVVSCGRAARATTKLRVRQPLPKMEIFHRRADLIRRHEELIRDELNVKRIDVVAACDIDQYVHYEIKPDFKKLGPKFGPLAPKIKAALAAHKNVDAIVKQLEQTGSYTLAVGDQEAELSADELLVELHAREGWAAERIPGQGILVLDTHLTPELLDEGIARDLVNQVQQVRKNLNLRYEQRIDLAVLGDADIGRVVNAHATHIRNETLAQSLLNQPIRGAQPVQAEIEGHPTEIFVKPL